MVTPGVSSAVIFSAPTAVDLQQRHRERFGTERRELASMRDLIDSGPAGLDLVRSLVKGGGDALAVGAHVALLAPIPLPPQIRDSMNFLGHLENAIDGRNRRSGITERSKAQSERIAVFLRRPSWYKANRCSVTGTGRVVAWPRYSSYVDYEHELACVLWKGGKDIPAAEAEAHIFGYMNFNDLSAPDVQPDEMAQCGPTKSKDFYDGNVFGPWILTADEFDPATARMRSWVNGELVNEGRMSDMHYSFANMVGGYSLEMTAKDVAALRTAAPDIFSTTPIAVTFLPNENQAVRVAAVKAVRDLGFEPMPHFSARRIGSAAEFEDYLAAAVADAGVRRCFVIAGDPATPEGPFEDSSALIASGAFERYGIAAIGVGGHPEGHPNMTEEQGFAVLEAKCAEIVGRGMAPLVVTQFAFDAGRVLAWLLALHQRQPDVPVRIGIPGSAGIKTLMRFAALRRGGLDHGARQIRHLDRQAARVSGTRPAGRRGRPRIRAGPPSFLFLRRLREDGRVDQRLRPDAPDARHEEHGLR